MSQSQKPVAALFPGQGSQHVGMAKDLFDNFKSVREIFEEASDAAHVNLKKLCFDGPESDLVLTENTQPCLLTASYAAFRVAQEEAGFKPNVVAGHSLGEYTALVASGALPLSSAVRWVKERGAAMQRAVPPGQGTMAAIMGLEDDAISTLCEAATVQAKEKRSALPKDEIPSVEAIVQAANYNAPGQIVIAGSIDGIQEAIALVKSGDERFKGGKAIQLQVSAPFHCKLMLAARNRMAEIFATASSHERPSASNIQCAYIPNRTARLTREPGVVFDLLIEQVDHPVLWKQSISNMMREGFTQAVEFGPGKVLQGLGKRISAQVGQPLNMVGVNDSTTLKSLETFLKGASE